MRITATKAIEFLGIAAVVASLLFLAMELRQSNKIAMASSENEIRTAQRDRYLTMLENPDLWELEVKMRNGDELNAEETIAMRNFVTAIFTVWASAMQQYNNDVLSEYTLNVQIDNMKVFFRDFPSSWNYLAQLRDDFDLVPGINIMWDVLNEELANRGL